MGSIIHLLEQPYNIVYVVLAMISILIWLVSAIGLFSHSMIEGLFDFDTDVDLEADGDINSTLLAFLSVGKIPMTIILTVVFFVQAIIGIALNQKGVALFSPAETWQIWTIFFVNFLISLVIAMLLGGIIVRPLRPIFKDYGEATKANSLVGKTAVVSSSEVSKNFGSAKFKLDGGDIVDISIRPIETQSYFVRGQKVTIVDFDETKNLYFVMQA